jgi:integrase
VSTVYKRQKTKFFWAWGFDANGRRWDESTKQVDRKAAQLAARAIELKYLADPNWKALESLTLERALDLVIDYQRRKDDAENTIRATTYHGRHLVEILGAETMLPGITLSDTTRYMTKRLKQGASRHTVAKELKTLTQAMGRAEKLGLYRPKHSPKHYMPDELEGHYKPRDRWLSNEEYERLLAALAPHAPERDQRTKRQRKRIEREDRRDYLIAYCHLGVRKTELFDAQPGDYDEARRQLRVRGTKTDGADRVVPASAAAAEVLVRRNNRKKPFPVWSNPTRDLESACDRAGVGRVTPNDLRRTFCSWLCQAGVPERVCAELMGHKSTVMVRAVYGHLDQVGMRAAVAFLPAPAATEISAAVRPRYLPSSTHEKEISE